MEQLARKMERKRRRVLACLQASDHIVVSDEVTPCVLIGNAGLVTGDTLETIVARFTGATCRPLDVLVPPGRQYSLLRFSSETEAAAVCQLQSAPSRHSLKQTGSGGGGSCCSRPLHLFFVSGAEFDRLATVWCSAVPSGLLPPGARLLADFVSAAEEAAISASFDWPTADSLRQRRVLHYGHVFDYSTNGVARSHQAPPLPDWCGALIGRLLAVGGVSAPPDQLTVNHYDPGQGIAPHVDTHSQFDSCLVSISLLSTCAMQFDTVDGGGDGRDKRCVMVPRRSALVLSGESRYRWRHGIGRHRCDVTRAADQSQRLQVVTREERVSLTFRRVMPAGHVCRCPYPSVCDSQQQQQQLLSPSVDCDKMAASAVQLERCYVGEVYNRIAEHFSRTRQRAWPRVAQFVRAACAAGAVRLMVDLGCGSGRNLTLTAQHSPPAPPTLSVGIDASWQMCCTAAAAAAGDVTSSCCHRQLVTASCVSVPLRSSVADCLLCIAVLHHLASRHRRQMALLEIARLLAPRARALVTVWALEQRQSCYVTRRPPTSDTSTNVTNEPPRLGLGSDHPLPIHASRTEFQQQDVLVPWKTPAGGGSEGDVQLRYYHVYCEGELDEDVRRIKDVVLIDSYYDQGNWCVIFEKLPQPD